MRNTPTFCQDMWKCPSQRGPSYGMSVLRGFTVHRLQRQLPRSKKYHCRDIDTLLGETLLGKSDENFARRIVSNGKVSPDQKFKICLNNCFTPLGSLVLQLRACYSVTIVHYNKPCSTKDIFSFVRRNFSSTKVTNFFVQGRKFHPTNRFARQSFALKGKMFQSL